MLKRAFDLSACIIALAILSPVFLAVMAVLRVTGEGEVFYRQTRIGRQGRPFGLLKFATMLKDSPSMTGGYLTAKEDPRILPVGRFLRATKINELPQLLNIIAGDMSLIGPRPQAPPHFEVFPEHVQQEIIKVRPGLSGIGSIFFRGEEELLARYDQDERDRVYAEVIAPYKGDLEVWYVRNQTIGLDLKLIFLTIWVVLVPGSRIHHRILKDAPTVPDNLDL